MSDSTNSTTARLDRIEQTLTELAANRGELAETLGLVKAALGAKLGEIERLDRIERGVDDIRRAIRRAVAEEMNPPATPPR